MLCNEALRRSVRMVGIIIERHGPKRQGVGRIAARGPNRFMSLQEMPPRVDSTLPLIYDQRETPGWRRLATNTDRIGATLEREGSQG